MDQEEPRWFKSSYSGGSGTECVEMAFTAAGASVRDSKRSSEGRFHVGPNAWTGFVGSVRAGELH